MALATRRLKRVDLLSVVFYRMRGFAGDDATYLRDMCRYDFAFEIDGAPGVYAFPAFNVAGSGRVGGRVTTARWRSFGVTPVPFVDDLEIDDLEIETLGDRLLKDGGRTWQHPRSGEFGAADYGRLVPLTLDQARDWLAKGA